MYLQRQQNTDKHQEKENDSSLPWEGCFQSISQ